MFAIQVPQTTIEIFVQNQIDGSALLELNRTDIEDMLENTDTASPGEIDETNVIKILTQIQKLKIIWYKTLKKMKMLDSYRETLKEFGIVGENIPENNSQVDNSNSFFKNKLAKNVRPEVDDLNNSFMNLDQKLLAALKK